MGASPSCDYSEYVPKTEYDQQKSRTLARLTACQDTNKPGKCNFSKFIASTNAYIKRPMFRTNYITQTECARQRQTCEKERPRRIKDLEKIAPLVPLSPLVEPLASLVKPASASSADSREETSCSASIYTSCPTGLIQRKNALMGLPASVSTCCVLPATCQVMFDSGTSCSALSAMRKESKKGAIPIPPRLFDDPLKMKQHLAYTCCQVPCPTDHVRQSNGACKAIQRCKDFNGCVMYNLKNKSGADICDGDCTVKQCCDGRCKDTEYFDTSQKQCVARTSRCNTGFKSTYQSDFEDDICVCKVPADTEGYVVHEKNTSTDERFDVQVECDRDNGYVGIAKVEKCKDAKGGTYSLAGCRKKCERSEFFSADTGRCEPLTACASNEVEAAPPVKNFFDDEYSGDRKCDSYSCKDGEFVKVDLDGNPLRDAEGKVLCGRKCPDVKNEYYVSDDIDGIYLEKYALQSKTTEKYRQRLPTDRGCEPPCYKCCYGGPNEVKKNGEIPMGLRVEVTKSDVEKPTFVYKEGQPLLHIPRAYPSVEFMHWGQVSEEYVKDALEALKAECDHGKYKDKCDGIVLNPNKAKCSRFAPCYNNNTTNGVAFLIFKDEHLMDGMKQAGTVKLRDVYSPYGLYYKKTTVAGKPPVKTRCASRNVEGREYQDETGLARRHWNRVFRTRDSAAKFKACLRSKKTQDACQSTFEREDREAYDRYNGCVRGGTSKKECLGRTRFHYTNYLRASPDGAHPGCTLYQRLVREPGLPSYCEDICDFSKQYFDKDANECRPVHVDKRCHRGQRCILSTKVSDNRCEDDVCSGGLCDGLWPSENGVTNFQFSSKQGHRFSCKENEVYTYYKPPKRRFGWIVKNVKKNLCKPTKESLNVFFDNGGFDTTKSTYACNRASQGEVCKPLLDTVEGYNVKKLSAYACSGNTKLNTSTCGMRYLKSRGKSRCRRS